MNAQQSPAFATLADYTKLELILPQLAGRAIASVMRELSDALHREDASVLVEHLFSPGVAALHRELLGSRIADLGATFPHMGVPALARPCFVLGRSSEPLPWLASAFRPIDLVFLILEPASPGAEFGQLLGTLHRLGGHEARLSELRRAPTVSDILAVLAQFPLLGVDEVVQPKPIAVVPPDTRARNRFNYRRGRY